MIINVCDIWSKAAQQHTSYLSDILDKGIQSIKEDPKLKLVVQFLESNRNAILSTTPFGLSGSISDYCSKFKTDEQRKAAKKALRKIFNYNKFIKKPDCNDSWCAYALCERAKYSFCSYCHISPTDTVPPTEEDMGYRPNIDHYYAKAEYPFLALTLGNFIPCCEKCNGRQMKGTIDFSKKPHLNPLLDKESIEFELTLVSGQAVDIAKGLSLSLNKESYQLSLSVVSNEVESKASLKTFQLVNRYKPYLGDAFHLARRLRGSRSRIEMQNEALDFEVDYEDYLGFSEADYKSTGLGKMKLCIAKKYM